MIQISVVIPVYKAERFLERAVMSALTCPQVREVVLVEDGSPDGSLAVCKRLLELDKRLKLHRHPGGVNKGAGATRNLGIDQASSEFIAFLDADDFYLPHRFELDQKILADNPDADGVYSAIGITYDEDTPELRAAFQEREFVTMPKAIPPKDLFDWFGSMGGKGRHLHLNTITVRKAALERTQGFNPELRLMQDTELILRLSLVAQLYPGQLDEAVAVRGVHGFNRSTNQNEIQRYYRILMLDSLLSWRRAPLSVERRQKLFKLYIRELNMLAPGRAGVGRRLFKIRKLISLVTRHPRMLGIAARYSFGRIPRALSIE